MTSADPTPPRLSSETLDPRLSPRGKVLLPLGLLLLIGFTVHRLFIAEPPPLTIEISGPTMGTGYSVKLDLPSLGAEEREVLSSAIRARLDEVNGLMSTYDPDSELSRFNASQSTDPQPMSASTLRVLEVAQRVSAASEGALDVTVGPLVDAWGFGPSEQPFAAPSEPELSELLERVGFQRLTVDVDGGTLTKDHPGVVVDLSAVAKGYAVDRVAEILDSLGYHRYLVEVGGELRAGDAKRDGAPWRVAVETPDAAARAVFGVLDVTRQGIATSGDYRNFYELDGVEYAHLIDPRTARPVLHSGVSVSVLHVRAALADAWATALSVLGPEEGFDLAEREGLAALFISRSEDGFAARATTAFRERHGDLGERR
jgi:thiamine biosynthesis lipoprotein